MEYYPMHPGVYGITVGSTTTATRTENISRKRQREDESRDVRRNSEHDRSKSTSSAAVDTPATTRRRTGGSHEVNQIGEATDTTSLPNTTVNPSPTAAPTLSSTTLTAPTAPTTSTAPTAPAAPAAPAASTSAANSADAKRLEQLAKRKQRQEERLKSNVRNSIARKVGHDVDSDGEREYWRACRARDRAEEARREALSPEARRQEDIDTSAKFFRDHIKPRFAFEYSGTPHLDHYPLFVLQTAPESRNGAGCKLRDCTARITPGQYRIAISPGEHHWASPDYYHVGCFEELLDLSSPHYVVRFVPDARKHMPDHGANCILQEYISRWKLRIQQRKDASQAPDQEGKAKENTIAGQGIVQNASAEAQSSTAETTTKQQTPVPGSSTKSPMQEQVRASSDVVATGLAALADAAGEPSLTSSENAAIDAWTIGDALWESGRQGLLEASHEHMDLFDAPDSGSDAADVAKASADQDRSWQITQYLLPESDPDHDERHALSQALEEWDLDCRLAHLDTDELTDAGRAAKEALGPLTIKRIKRYAVVRMPDYQSAFLRGM